MKENWHLLEHVTLWDVGVERIVEIGDPEVYPGQVQAPGPGT